MNPAIDFFEHAVRRHRRQMRIVSLVMILVAVVGAAWGLSEDHPDRAMARMAAMSMLGLVVFSGILVASFFPHRGLAALREPGRIVWFYGVAKHGYVQQLLIGLDNGKLRSLPLPHHSKANEALGHLSTLAPGATSGFSEQLRVAFKKDPSSLRQAA